MNLDEFRRQLECYRREADEEAASRRDSCVAADRLHALYRRFDAGERGMADQVLAEWVLAEDEGVRFDAFALITDFKIRTAEPAIRVLAQRLALSSTPGAPYELKKIDRILRVLAES